jgi:3-oxoacyl-[acyl-carrier protein] reductase
MPLLRRSDAGRVIFISSQWGQLPDGHSYGYMVSKAAQLGLMKALAAELIPHKILVNAVAPGAVHTRMVPDEVYEAELAAVPLGRIADPAEISAAVAFLASDGAAFITGQTLAVNGGALIPSS